VRQREVGAVIVFALDRLSRKQAHVAIVADECERAGVALLFATEEYEQSAVGEFIRSAKAFAAEPEREKIRERTVHRGARVGTPVRRHQRPGPHPRPVAGRAGGWSRP
jgi:DNA invertase Pin-like site-specific DNA recombinase